MCEWQCCPLLKNAAKYLPDTFNLFADTQAAKYWFPCFRELIIKFAEQAKASQRDVDAEERAQQYRQTYLAKLDEYEQKAVAVAAAATTSAAGATTTDTNETLSTREVFELNDKLMRRFGFPDPWQQQKQQENQAALAVLSKRLSELDAIENCAERWTEIVRGVLAGNIFDWGAQEVADILAKDKNFGLHAALDKIQKRPWLMDNLDDWLQRQQDTAACPHKCATIFVDNSGFDFVLGILPFARELLKRGTSVLLCANSEPSLNDVTSSELNVLLKDCSCHCSVLAAALNSKTLLVYGNGQRGPCLDMRRLPVDLCEAIKTYETDLLVIEGMGRAAHTNLYAKFNCETLKLAVIKNKWMAQRFGGDTFAAICKYER